MHEGTAENYLLPLPAAKTLGPPVSEFSHVQGVNDFLNPLLQPISGNSVERTIVPEMLSRSESRVNAARIRLHS